MINKNIFIRTVSMFMLVFICTFFFGCGVSENKIASITYQNSNGDKVTVKSYYICEVDKAYIVDYTTREELMVLYENDGNKSYYIGGSPNSQGFTANVYYNSSDIPYTIRNKGTSFAVGPKIPRG
ncbi:MAG: hypothetical protein IJW28_04475, partial [Clostridia bacterium]|nr:hypothetical protein [Clostridia bacterium]